MVEIFIGQRNNTFGSFNPFEVSQVCFAADSPPAPETSYCTGAVSFETKPLGDEWGSPKGWGGQKLVPDQIFTHIGKTPYDESDFSWGLPSPTTTLSRSRTARSTSS